MQTQLIKDEFFANMAHDLKSPINSQIQVLKFILSSKKESDEEKELLSQLLNSNLHLQNLIQNLMTKFKTSSNNFSLNKKEINFKNFLTNILQKTFFILDDKNLTLKINYLSKKEFVQIDEIEIERVFLNLITNAARHAKNSSIIEINIENSDDKFIISIINEGAHIKDLNEIFKIYQTGSKTSGTGLGLYICKKIITTHGGKIYAQNIDPNKVKFTFTLPV